MYKCAEEYCHALYNSGGSASSIYDDGDEEEDLKREPKTSRRN
jgi:hypothetical protein